MTEINIAGAIDKLMIFDDPEYCSSKDPDSKDYSCCPKLHYTEEGISIPLCREFSDDSGFMEELLQDSENNVPVKCDQCKEAYRKIKEQKKVIENAIPKLFKE